MKSKITIVGSGASAVHFCLTLLEKGYDIEMVDVGYSDDKSIDKKMNFFEIIRTIKNPYEFFLGKNLETVVPPGTEEIYRFPPQKEFVFKKPEFFIYKTDGFSPLFSFAKGGLGEAWTGGVYPFNDDELEDYPFDYNELKPYYEIVAKRIGINGENDDLAEIFPYHSNIMEPLELDEHSFDLYKKYETYKRKKSFDKDFILGRSRIAVLTESRGEREKCSYCGLCQWDCSSNSLYVPSITLKKCFNYKNFTYIPNKFVKYFVYSNGKIKYIVTKDVVTGEVDKIKIDILALGAGTLSTSYIYLNSIYKNTGEIIKLRGLMDNRQVLAPFINISMIFKEYGSNLYQYHLLSAGVKTPNKKFYVHGQITTLKTGLIHPAISSYPLDMKSGIQLFKIMRKALGVLNINFPDERRYENYVTIIPDSDENPKLFLRYIPEKNENKKIDYFIKKYQKAFVRMGIIMPSFQMRIRKMGESVHYAGTIPMKKNGKGHTVNENCRSNLFENLYIIDGSTFPYLPAKNITFTLMANATRVADKEF